MKRPRSSNGKVNKLVKAATKIVLSETSVVAWFETDGFEYDEELLDIHEVYEDELRSKCEDYDRRRV